MYKDRIDGPFFHHLPAIVPSSLVSQYELPMNLPFHPAPNTRFLGMNLVQSQRETRLTFCSDRPKPCLVLSRMWLWRTRSERQLERLRKPSRSPRPASSCFSGQVFQNTWQLSQASNSIHPYHLNVIVQTLHLSSFPAQNASFHCSSGEHHSFILFFFQVPRQLSFTT